MNERYDENENDRYELWLSELSDCAIHYGITLKQAAQIFMNEYIYAYEKFSLKNLVRYSNEHEKFVKKIYNKLCGLKD